LYSDGSGLIQDHRQAEKWFFQAAQQGFGPSKKELEDIYRFGLGAPEDIGENVKWYRAAAIKGIVPAQAWLGDWHSSGDRRFGNYWEAVTWYTLAADQGDLNPPTSWAAFIGTAASPSHPTLTEP